jgi:type IV pilus assembly protein PilW
MTHGHPLSRRLRPAGRALGFSLVEVMVSVALSGLLIAGAVEVFSQSSKTYGVHETASRLEENARYVFSVLEPDIRMASYWGLMKGSAGIVGASAQTAAAAGALAGAAATVCGNNFGVDLNNTLEASNDAYALGCAAWHNRPMPTADTLTVRRASFQPTTVAAGTAGPLRICSTRLSATLVNVANVAATCPAAPAGAVNDLIVHTYYVDLDSAATLNVPTLYRKSLNATPTFVDEEILPGVEDLQVQFGIDPTGITGIATQYVDSIAAAALPPAAQIVAVRIWVLLRAETAETGFVDNRVYQYANRAVANGTVATLTAAGSARKAYAPGDGFRRLLVSRTVMIRNALGT